MFFGVFEAGVVNQRGDAHEAEKIVHMPDLD
jgi:hypothetical protein